MAHSHGQQIILAVVGSLSFSPCGPLNRISHNMTADFPQSELSKKEQGKATMTFIIQSQKSHTTISALLLVTWVSPVQYVKGLYKSINIKKQESLKIILEAYYHSPLSGHQRFMPFFSKKYTPSFPGPPKFNSIPALAQSLELPHLIHVLGWMRLLYYSFRSRALKNSSSWSKDPLTRYST